MFIILSIVLIISILVVLNKNIVLNQQSGLQCLNPVQIRYRIATGHSICIKDKLRDLYMIIHPIDFKSARISIPKINLNSIHVSELSIISEIMELIDERKVEVYDGEYFIASRKN